ncbi:MAG: hypothetical protein U1F81_13365 [Verrucomicrobiaceae bacterium]
MLSNSSGRLLAVFFAGFSVTAALAEEEMTKESMARGVRSNPTAYDEVRQPREGAATARIKLGETVSEAREGWVFDGLRITAPKDMEGRDFVWYFNGPTEWGNWFIVPVSGEFDGGFKNWIDADILYREHDRAQEKDRQHVLQTLDGSYFEPGRDYFLWFRRVDDDAAQNKEVRVVFDFVRKPAKQKEWDAEAIEKALGLKHAAAADQVAHLGSRGGRAMLDESLFDAADARGRIKDVLSHIRRTSRLSGGFFVTMEISCPPCQKTPKMADIQARHGPPDCVISSAEAKRVSDHAGGTPEEDDGKLLHYYDYFAFETRADDPEGRVHHVRTHASDFGALRVPEKGLFVRQVEMKNLSVFFQDGKETGRMYYFLEGSKTPFVIKAPPAGRYALNDETVLEHEGGGKWQWLSLNGTTVTRRVPMEENVMHGVSEGYYADGTLRFKAPYRRGRLHGEVVEMDESGKVTRKLQFRDGKEVSDEDAAAPRKGPKQGGSGEPAPKPKAL